MNTRIALGLMCFGAVTGCQYSRSPDMPSSTQTTGTVIETPAQSEPRYGNFTPHPVTAERQRPQKKPVTTTSAQHTKPAPAPAPAVETHEMIPPPAEAPHTRAPLVDDPGNADRTPHADNTGNNKRDRDGAAVTPMDQGNSGDETKITAAIRKEMMSDKSLSFTAKNAKVITQGKNVTLRGTVKSEAERAIIEAIARHTDGVGSVVNQLEVKN